MQSWSTRHLPPAQQFGYWREVLFNDSSNFCRMFRRRYGMSASEWQRERAN